MNDDCQIKSETGRVIQNPPLARFFFEALRMAPVWLIVRVLVGWAWLENGWSKLTGNRPDWWEGDARLSYKLNSKYTLSGFVAPARRFNVDNTLFEARIEYKPGPKFNDYLFVVATPDAAFFPQWGIGCEGDLEC